MDKINISGLTVMQLSRIRRTCETVEIWGYFPRKDLSNVNRRWDTVLYDLITECGFTQSLDEQIDDHGRCVRRYKRTEEGNTRDADVVASIETCATFHEDGNISVYFSMIGTDRTFSDVFELVREYL